MDEYEVLFEIYGKRLKVLVGANSLEDAANIVKSDVKFHKITKVEPYPPPSPYESESLKKLMDIFGLKP